MQPYEILESELAQWCGRETVVCSSGTAALHLALEALHLPPGSEVIVPDFTMIACARAVTLAGLRPVFVDCDDNGLIDHTLVDRAIYGGSEAEARRNNVTAIMAVHVYGRSCYMSHIAYSAKNACLALVEDLAEAHGLSPHYQTDAACWSFYRNKVIAGEEGGAIAFRDDLTDTTSDARLLRSMGFTDAHDFTHIPRGHNYRLANCLAQRILDSLHSYKYNLRVRKHLESRYDEYCPANWRMPKRDIPWVYDIRIPLITHKQQDYIVRNLNKAGIAARHAFKPLSLQEEYKGCRLIKSSIGHMALRLSTELIYLPIDPTITEVTIEQTMGKLKWLYNESALL